MSWGLAAGMTLALGLSIVACADTAPVEKGMANPHGLVRVAAFNIKELSRQKLDDVDSEGVGRQRQLRAAAEIIQRVRPDLLLVNEIDFDAEGTNAQRFVDRYVGVSQGGQAPIDYPFIHFDKVNTGLPTGRDLDRDGQASGPGDAHGFGHYAGQYGMALLSRFPVASSRARSFRRFLWHQMPGNLLPDGRDGKPAWYSDDEAAILRLSSKSHWDVPVRVGEAVLHVLACHPTPPLFDGEEDRNGRRNFDEIRLWADYLTGGETASYVMDDAGDRGGLAAEASFVIVGDMNADRHNDAAPYGTTAIGQLLEHSRVRDPGPRGAGGASVDRPYRGPGQMRTSAWGRLDYVLPSRDLEVRGCGVFWPAPGDPLHRLVAGDASSDHRLVWVDLVLPVREPPAAEDPP